MGQKFGMFASSISYGTTYLPNGGNASVILTVIINLLWLHTFETKNRNHVSIPRIDDTYSTKHHSECAYITILCENAQFLEIS